MLQDWQWLASRPSERCWKVGQRKQCHSGKRHILLVWLEDISIDRFFSTFRNSEIPSFQAICNATRGCVCKRKIYWPRKSYQHSSKQGRYFFSRKSPINYGKRYTYYYTLGYRFYIFYFNVRKWIFLLFSFAGGLSAERKLYLFNQIRPYVQDHAKEITCPPPDEEWQLLFLNCTESCVLCICCRVYVHYFTAVDFK